ncbi:PfkB family carbohydrate kinase [Ligilactobacillus salivarius]|uniref:PfkB family carbohydrate kinase n=1 Tax=Ligilactobacillus salivarius TaxID=1624 RepID=UPI0033152677
MENKQLLVAEDLSAVGDLSLTVATPILQCQNIPVAVLPTSVLSTQSEGFGTPAILPTENWIKSTFDHWSKEQLDFSGILIGYFNNQVVGQELLHFIESHSLDLVVIDPAFADDGAFYPGLDDNHLATIKKLLQHATITTPNLTEAKFLTGLTELDNSYESLTKLLLAMKKLIHPGGNVVITDIVFENKHGCVYEQDGEVTFYSYPQLPGHFYGSGDVFSALLTSFLWHGKDFHQAVKKTTKLTFNALMETATSHRERRYGINLSRLLQLLILENEGENYEN